MIQSGRWYSQVNPHKVLVLLVWAAGIDIECLLIKLASYIKYLNVLNSMGGGMEGGALGHLLLLILWITHKNLVIHNGNECCYVIEPHVHFLTKFSYFWDSIFLSLD